MALATVIVGQAGRIPAIAAEEPHPSGEPASASDSVMRPETIVRGEVSERLMPGEGIEPPTFGLQNRCTTAVLTRLARLIPRGDGRVHRARPSGLGT
jgi:hypothetical protein